MTETTEAEARRPRVAIYFGLLEKLPVLDLCWPEAQQAQWWGWLDKIITGLYDH